MTDDSHLLELRRRVQADPASIAFAELAEECRRIGNYDEAVGLCRRGLLHHPGHLAARITLGRALVELDKLDDAFAELTQVLDTAPGNLPAIRALAEIYQRRGMMSEALVHYRRALQLAQDDADLSQAVDRSQHVGESQGKAADPAPPPIADLFDFDALLAQLDSTRSMEAPAAFMPLRLPPHPPAETAIPADDDAFAAMERQLREREEQRLVEEKHARQAEANRRRALVMQELEDWLAAIVHDRRHPTTPTPRHGGPDRSQPSA